MTPPVGQLQQWVQEASDEVNRYERLLHHDDVPANRTPYLQRSLAREVELVGLASLPLEGHDSRAWLRRAAQVALASVTTGRELAGEHGSASAPGLARALRTGYLAAEPTLVERAHEEVESLPEEYAERFPSKATLFYRLRTTDALLAGDEERAAAALETMDQYVTGRETEVAAMAALEGLVSGDPVTISDGIRALCDRTRERVPADPAERIRGDGLSRVGVFLQAVAVDRDHDVAIDHECLLDPPPWPRQPTA